MTRFDSRHIKARALLGGQLHIHISRDMYAE
jgi:hypothetical protein